MAILYLNLKRCFCFLLFLIMCNTLKKIIVNKVDTTKK